MKSPDSPPTARRRFSRRKFLLLGGVLLAPPAAVADAAWLEPEWIKIRTVRLKQKPPARQPPHRLVHITDIHHKGDRAYLEKIVHKVNALKPDSVCFTGDLIEEARHLPEAVEVLAGLKAPLYAVPGNHDYWSKVSFEAFESCCEATGGAWLLEKSCLSRDGKINLVGSACIREDIKPPAPRPGIRNVLLVHYPAWVKVLTTPYDLILAGHSHGGQVRLPFYGALIVPFGVDEYEVGLFETKAGPLYVHPGLGWFPVAIRFNCRPEITLFEL